ncbi:MAG TPA: nuclear transport factor 2 family protein [Acidimicrobiia bacterium]|nr:nuclear transport factor 2 family protein [Acidimicrobiia bacterium]
MARDRLLELEAEFWEAAGDPDFYRTNFADDGLMALPVGIMTKSEVVAAIDGAPARESFTIDDPRYVEVGDDVAALVYATVAREPGADEEYRALITSVYVNRGGDWRLVLHQQTPV